MKFSEYYKELLKETTLSRIWQHLNNNCMIAISAERDEFSSRENKIRSADLQKQIKIGNFGFTKITGGFTENKGSKNEVDVEEVSFLVFFKNDRFDEAIKYFKKLCKEYNQDSILVVKDKISYWLDKDGNTEKLGNWKPRQLDVYFSKLKNGRKFSFDTAILKEDFSGNSKGLNFYHYCLSNKVKNILNKAIKENISYEEAEKLLNI